MHTFCDGSIGRVTWCSELQAQGLKGGYLNMSAVSLIAKGVRRTFRADRKPKDLLFFTVRATLT